LIAAFRCGGIASVGVTISRYDAAMSLPSQRASWSAFDRWRPPAPSIDWLAAVDWEASFDRLRRQSANDLEERLGKWDKELSAIGGDPSREDWSAFRPLRLSREEDWSDWLAHLLATSTSGAFSARLFADVDGASRREIDAIDREYSAGDYRADLVIRFKGDAWLHLEVKVGDLSLEKTTKRGDALRAKCEGTCLGDLLLLPKHDRRHWDAIASDASKVHVLDWHDVARALRASIREDRQESLSWRVWARAYLGAVEQLLLGLPVVRAGGAARSLQRRITERLEWMIECEAKR
jgi:hypothetical protein